MSIPDFNLFKAIVRSANSITGICQVEIPGVMGSHQLITVSNIGLHQVNGVWNVPAVGDHTFVAVNDTDRAFWVAESAYAAAAAAANVALVTSEAFATNAANAASAGAVTTAETFSSAALAAHVAAADPHPVYYNLSRLTTALAPYAGRRNLLHNGAHRVCQMGTIDGATFSISVAGSTGSYLPSDRWGIQNNMTAAMTAYRYNDSAAHGNISAFDNHMILQFAQQASLSAGQYIYYSQMIEGRDLTTIGFGGFDAQPLTLSWWGIYNRTGTYICELQRSNGTSGPVTLNRSICAAFTVSTTARAFYSVTFPADTGGSPEISDNLGRLNVVWWLCAGSTFNTGNVANLNTSWANSVANTGLASGCTNFVSPSGVAQLNATQMQLEVGSVATPYEMRSYDEELLTCQRYWHRFAQPKWNGVAGGAASAPVSRLGGPLVPPMRAAPALTINGNMTCWDGASAGTFSALGNQYSTYDVVEFDSGATTLGALMTGDRRSVTTYQLGTAGSIDADARI